VVQFPGSTSIVQAIQASQQNIPHPLRFEGLFDPVLRLAGVKSWATFMKGTASVDVDDDGQWLTFEPSKNQGPRAGYTPLSDRKFRLPRDATSEEIGQAVEKAIALCE
jgi:hypothetical protein